METLDLPRLALKAEDHEDLHILSSHVQDAFVPHHSLSFSKDLGCFSMQCHRFCWEHDSAHIPVSPEAHVERHVTLHPLHEMNDTPPTKVYHRALSHMQFNHIEHVQFCGFQLGREEQPLNLLAVQPHSYEEARKNPLFAPIKDQLKKHLTYIDLVFSGNQHILLHTQKIHSLLKDVDHPQPTYHKPCHDTQDSL